MVIVEKSANLDGTLQNSSLHFENLIELVRPHTCKIILKTDITNYQVGLFFLPLHLHTVQPAALMTGY